MTIETNLNVSPYFDDYSEDNDFYRVLFRPGVAIQARELNQLQNILQNQIERFGDHVFKSGTIISGINFQFNDKYDYVKILDNNTSGQPVTPSAYVNLLVRNSSNLIARIVNSKSGFQSQDPEMNYIYLKYLNSGSTKNIAQFSNSDVLTIYSDTFSLFDTIVGNGGSGFSNSDAVQITSALIVNSSNVAIGANVVQTSGANSSYAYVTEVNTTFGTITLNNITYSNTGGYRILKIRPNDTDLACTSFTSSRWTITSNASITQGVNTAFVVASIGSNARAVLTTDGSGIITDVSVASGGSNYVVLPDVRVRSSTGVLGSVNIVPQNYKDIVTVADSSFTGNSTTPVGNAYAFSVTEGIIYQKGLFLRVEPQTIIVNNYSSNAHDVAVGFVSNESIVNSSVDQTLLDNATGTTNFTAPGANRLKLVPALAVANLSSVVGNSSFFTLVEFKEGEPYKQNKTTVYNLLAKEHERRTSESEGDYVVNPFVLTTKDRFESSWSNSVIDLAIDPGVAYVSGKRVDTNNNTFLPIRRASDIKSSTDNIISLNYGNFIFADEYVGYFDFKSGAAVDLYDTPKNYISTNSTTISPAGNKIGEARIRSIMFDSGIPGTSTAKYRLYVYDIRMNSGKTFIDVRSVYNSSGTKGIADIVLDTSPITSAPIGRVQDSGFSSLVFPIGALGVSSVNNTIYTYRTSNTSASITTAATVTLTITDVFPYTNNATLNSIQRRDFILIPTANGLSQNTATSITCTSSNSIVNGASLTTVLSVGDHVYIENSSNSAQTLTTTVSLITNATHMTVANAWSYSTTANCTVQRFFPEHVPIPLDDDRVSANVNSTRNEVVINLSNTTNQVSFASGVNATLTYNANKVATANISKRIKRNLFIKLDLSTHPASNNGPWCLGIPDVFRLNKVYVATTSSVNTSSSDVTRYFFVDNGQKNDYYSHAHLTTLNQSKFTLTTSNWLLVDVDAYDLNSSTDAGIFTVNSYPIAFNNSNTSVLANNFVNILEIPEFKSTKGDIVDLRDSIDFRPRVTSTANLTSTIGLATTNPANTISFGTHDKLFPTPDTEFNFDYDFYLRRSDRVIIDTEGNIKVIEGVPASNRVVPPPPLPDTITIGIVDVPPYPSLPRVPDNNIISLGGKKTGTDSPIYYKVSKYSVDSRIADGQYEFQPRRYSMEDIGKLERRLEDLEYYTSLNLLETKTKDLIIPSTIDPSLNRFKNGFFVEQFNDYYQADTLSQEYTACIDQINGFLCPQEATYNFQARFNYSDATTAANLKNETGLKVEPGLGVWGESVLTLPVTNTEIVINQSKFTSPVNGDGTDTKFIGDIGLQPNTFKVLLTAEIRLTGDDAGPAPPPPGGGGSGCKIICQKLSEIGLLNKDINRADQLFGMMLSKKYPTIYNGYMYWAPCVVRMIEGEGPIDNISIIKYTDKNTNSFIVNKVALFYVNNLAMPWSEEMARLMSVRTTSSIEGKFVLYTGGAICWLLGKMGFKKSEDDDSTLKKMTVWGGLTLLLLPTIAIKFAKWPINICINKVNKLLKVLGQSKRGYNG